MTSDQLAAIIEAGENLDVEFKGEARRLAPHGKLKGTHYALPSPNMDSSKTDLDAPKQSKRPSKGGPGR